MKYFTYILFAIVGFSISYWVLYNGGEASYFSILLGFWTGYFGHMILNWDNKK